MVHRKGLVYAAACAAMALAGLAPVQTAQAATDVPASDSLVSSGLTLSRETTPVYLDDATTAPAVPATAPAAGPTPLMALLDTTPVGKALEDAKIQIYGRVEGSYTYSASAPPAT